MNPNYFFSAFIFFPAVSFAGIFGPNNYEECVLESMKGVTSDVAARAIIRSCTEKFPAKKPSEQDVPPWVSSNLDGRAGMSFGYFRGNIYNGNKDWTITSLTIALTPKAKNKSSVKTRPREYRVDVYISPLTNGSFGFSAASEEHSDFDWTIVNARGHQSR